MTVLQFSPHSLPKVRLPATDSDNTRIPIRPQTEAHSDAVPSATPRVRPLPQSSSRSTAPAPAPIALFLYHRPKHTLRCLQSLASNPEFLDSPLYLFCDGAKEAADAPAVEEVRRIARALPHPRKVLFEATSNRGLAASVIAGVTQVVEEHGSVVVVEDDLVLAPTFLAFMNRSLHHYADDARVMQVSGHMYPIDPGSEDDAVFLPMACSWGWATWDRAWRRFDPDMRDYQTLVEQPGLRRLFNVDGAVPYFSILKRQRVGKADSWFIRWYLSLFMSGGMTLYPRHSLVRNEGFDGTGVHCGVGGCPYDASGALPHQPLTRLPDAGHVDAHALARVRTFLAAKNTVWQRVRRRLQALSALRPS
jgi:GT2 family glycosyltransferase